MENTAEHVQSLGMRIDATARRIRDRVLETPLVRAPWLDGPECRVFLKLENFQHTGSFKVRGAASYLAANRASIGSSVVTASTGNHGAAVAFAAAANGVKARIFVPQTASTAKFNAIRRLGATIVEEGNDALESERAARDYAEAGGYPYISPYNDEDVVCGQGTIAVEIVASLPSVQSIVVAVGGGGLAGGIAAYLHAVRPDAGVLGASPSASAVMARSISAGYIVDERSRPTLSDATAGGIEPGAITFPLCRDLLVGVRLAEESEIAAGMRDLILEQRVVGEGAAGCAIAGYRSAMNELRGDTVIVVCGGNASRETLAGIMRTD